MAFVYLGKYNDFLPFSGWTGGDPHIKTLDGHLYTFNGIGDYILLAVQNSSEFLVHCRMSKAKITPNATVSRSMATVFSGFAFAAEQGPTLEVYLNVSSKLPHIIDILLSTQEINSVILFYLFS